MSDLVGNPEDRFSQNEAHLKSAANPELDMKKLLFVFRMNMSMLIRTLALNTEEDGLSFSLSFGFLSCWTAVTMTKCY